MKKISTAYDVDGRPMEKGDTVATISGNTTAKICDLATDSEMAFVYIKPAHQPYGKGVWHAADHVQRIAVGRKPAAAKS